MVMVLVNPTGPGLPKLKEPSDVDTPSKKPNTNKKKKKALPPLKDPPASLKEASPGVHATKGSAQAEALKQPKVSAYAYEMFGHCHQTVDKYLELSGKTRESLKTRAATPCIDDHLIPPEELRSKGFCRKHLLELFLRLFMLPESPGTTSCGL